MNHAFIQCVLQAQSNQYAFRPDQWHGVGETWTTVQSLAIRQCFNYYELLL